MLPQLLHALQPACSASAVQATAAQLPGQWWQMGDSRVQVTGPRQRRGAGAPARSTRCSLERRKRWLLGDDDAVGLRRCSSCSVQIACLQPTHVWAACQESCRHPHEVQHMRVSVCPACEKDSTAMRCLQARPPWSAIQDAKAELVGRHGRRGPCERTSESCARSGCARPPRGARCRPPAGARWPPRRAPPPPCRSHSAASGDHRACAALQPATVTQH